ncbi:MAG: carbohydrate kinase family protein, partial [Spirochaetota bacterium]|nr:carbohydrate kinase family protein [Spirochaetota bacterium]
RLNDFNVNTDFIEIIESGCTPVAYIIVTKSEGKRTILYEQNTLPKIQIHDCIKDLLSYTDVVLLDPETTYLSKEIRSLSTSNHKIIYDCERWKEGIDDMMELADYFIPSSEFLLSEELKFSCISFEEKILNLKNMIKGELIVTNGSDGAYYIYNDLLYHIPVPEVKVADTIGAGDNFHAAFAFAISQAYNIHESVKFSVSAATLSCRDYGGRSGIPKYNDVISFADSLKEKIIDY